MYTNYRSSNHINILFQTLKPPVHTRTNIIVCTGGFSFFANGKTIPLHTGNEPFT